MLRRDAEPRERPPSGRRTQPRDGTGLRKLGAAGAALAAAACIACGSRTPGGEPASSTPGGAGAEPAGQGQPLYRRLVLSLEILPAARAAIDAGGTEQIWLVQTDETGAATRVELGAYPGPCRDVSEELAGAPMKPLMGAVCAGGEGVRLRLVPQGGDLVLLHALGASGDDLDFDEIRRIELPPGVPVTVEP